MTYKIEDYEVLVNIEKKKIKNTYIRVKENNTILVTTSYLTSKRQIINLLEKNKDYLGKCLKQLEEKKQKDQEFYLWGKKYDVVVIPTESDVIIEDEVITPSLKVIFNKSFSFSFLDEEMTLSLHLTMA